MDISSCVPVDLRSHRVSRVGELTAPLDVAVAGGQIWAVSQEGGDVVGVDAQTLQTVTRAKVPEHDPGAIAVGLGNVWVAGRFGPLYQIDPHTGRVVGVTRRVGRNVSALAISHGAVWAHSEGDSAVWRIVPGERPSKVAQLRGNPFGLRAGSQGIWVGTRADANA